jgi:hypothetical protein
MSPRRNEKPQGWEAAHDKPSHDFIDNRAPGGPRGRRAVLRVRQLAAQRLRRPGSGQPGDPRLGADRWGRLGGRWWLLGVERLFLRRRGRGLRRRRDGRCAWGRPGSRRQGRGHRRPGLGWSSRSAARAGQGARRRRSRVYGPTARCGRAAFSRRLGSVGHLRSRSRISALGAHAAERHGHRHEAAGTDADPAGRPAVTGEGMTTERAPRWTTEGSAMAKAIARKTRVTD